MRNVGRMYETGRAGVLDRTEAAKWYRRAADAGDTRGKESLERLGGQ